jgi:hypothetical protein
MLGRVVVEGEKCLFVFGDLGDGLGPLRPELIGELLDALYGLFLVLSTGDLLDGNLPREWMLFGIASSTFAVL